MEILRVENLTKIYGSGENEVRALDRVSFSVEKGEFLAIIGPSGSGKSTLIHILGGVDRPTDGKVFLNGQDVYAQNEEQLAIFRRREVGLIYQFYNLIPVLNAEENMTLPVLLDGRPVNSDRVEELLKTLGLSDRRRSLPNQLSGGQQQRVSIGRALMNAPSIVLADEPTGNLDSKNSQEIVGLLRESNIKYGQTLIVITHDENIALQADRIIAIEDGSPSRTGTSPATSASGGRGYEYTGKIHPPLPKPEQDAHSRYYHWHSALYGAVYGGHRGGVVGAFVSHPRRGRDERQLYGNRSRRDGGKATAPRRRRQD